MDSLISSYRTNCVDKNHYPPAKGCNGNRFRLPPPHREIPFKRRSRSLSESTGNSRLAGDFRLAFSTSQPRCIHFFCMQHPGKTRWVLFPMLYRNRLNRASPDTRTTSRAIFIELRIFPFCHFQFFCGQNTDKPSGDSFSRDNSAGKAKSSLSAQISNVSF